MNEPIKVLYFVDRMLRGGIQSLVIDWVSRFDKNKIHVDFLLLDDGKKYELEEKLKEFGCTVYKLDGVWINTPLDFIKEAKALDDFFKDHHDYKVVHMHSTSKNYMVLKYAKEYGIPIRISHAHASDFQTSSNLKKLIGTMLKPKLIKYSTHFFACSKEAGKWLFGNQIINSNRFEIIKNGIDFDKFKYNENNRIEIRNKYGIKDSDILIGHVGRFTTVKNHDFIIDVLDSLVKNDKRYKIMLIGEGILEEKIKNKVNDLGINEHVIFVGYQPDVSIFLSAFDLFILPSIYEGLGLVLIEAQANGLPCIATRNSIPTDVKINDNFLFIDLDKDLWVKSIINDNMKRCKKLNSINQQKYYINEVVKNLENRYKKYVKC